MSDEKYNGWANYETWVTKLWMDNDQGSADYWAERAQWFKNHREADQATYELSQEIKDTISDGTPEVEGLYADLMNAALSEVNWFEIAEALIEDLED